MKIKRKSRKLIKELKKMESGLFKFSDGKAIYYSLDEYLESLYKEIKRLNNIIDELEKYLIFQIRHTDQEYIFGEVYYKLKEIKEEVKE